MANKTSNLDSILWKNLTQIWKKSRRHSSSNRQDKIIWRHTSTLSINKYNREMDQRFPSSKINPRITKNDRPITLFLLLLRVINSVFQSHPTWSWKNSSEKSELFSEKSIQNLDFDNTPNHRRSICNIFVCRFLQSFSSHTHKRKWNKYFPYIVPSPTKKLLPL